MEPSLQLKVKSSKSKKEKPALLRNQSAPGSAGV
jgi:hypothetical protein